MSDVSLLQQDNKLADCLFVVMHWLSKPTVVILIQPSV